MVPHRIFAARHEHSFVEQAPLELHGSTGVINPALTYALHAWMNNIVGQVDESTLRNLHLDKPNRSSA